MEGFYNVKFCFRRCVGCMDSIWLWTEVWSKNYVANGGLDLTVLFSVWLGSVVEGQGKVKEARNFEYCYLSFT